MSRPPMCFLANGGDGSVRIFRGADFREIGRIELGDDADNIRIVPGSNRVLVGYSNGAIATTDVAQRRKIAEVSMPAHPEGFQLDRNTNRIFVNVPKAGAIVVIDSGSAKPSIADGQSVRQVDFCDRSARGLEEPGA